jgi:hypothetical protein
MKTFLLTLAALGLSAGSAWAQDKPSKKGDSELSTVLRELDKRLKAQRDEILKAVERMLDERLGRDREWPREQAKGGQKKHPARKHPGKRGKKGKKPGDRDDD